jgi:hypothetical protein
MRREILWFMTSRLLVVVFSYLKQLVEQGLEQFSTQYQVIW